MVKNNYILFLFLYVKNIVNTIFFLSIQYFSRISFKERKQKIKKKMTTIYNACIDFIKEVKNETNVRLTKREYVLNECERQGRMTLKWWKTNGVIIISDIQLETPTQKNKNVLTLEVTKLLSRDREDLDPARLVIQSFVLEGVYDEVLSKKLMEKGWYTEGLSNLRFY